VGATVLFLVIGLEEEAIALARDQGTELHVLHVVELVALEPVHGGDVAVESLEEAQLWSRFVVAGPDRSRQMRIECVFFARLREW
jgi:hypothetical protein